MEKYDVGLEAHNLLGRQVKWLPSALLFCVSGPMAFIAIFPAYVH